LSNQKNVDHEDARQAEDWERWRDITGAALHHLDRTGDNSGETTKRNHPDQSADNQNRFGQTDWRELHDRRSYRRGEVRSTAVAIVEANAFGAAGWTIHLVNRES